MIEDTVWRGQLNPVKNLKIKIIGRMQGQDRFRADEIRPWQGHGRRHESHNCQFPEQKNVKELLIGEIHKIISAKEIRFKDLQGHIGTVDITDTVWRGKLNPVKNLKIRVFGNKESASRFVAAEIRPRRGHGQRHRQPDSECGEKKKRVGDWRSPFIFR